jgi:hypothetical protein
LGNSLLAPTEERPGGTELCDLKHTIARISRFLMLDKVSVML